MRLSQKCTYALRAMLELALRSGEAPSSIAAIGAAQGIPEQFLQVIMRELRQGGFVESRRGKAGGYLLSRHPRDINVGEVLRFVEGEFIPVDDTEQNPVAFTELWQGVQAAANAILDVTTFADLAARQRQHNTGAAADYVI